MGIKASIIKPFAKRLASKAGYDALNAVSIQKQIFEKNLYLTKGTHFGSDHNFVKIKNYNDWKKAVPLRDYEGLKSYIDRIKKGEHNVLWPGLPKYFVGTSGTTSGIKYIPLTKESMPYHLNSGRNAVLSFAYRNNLLSIMDHKLIFLSGSPQLDRSEIVPIGRLSGIINHEIPWWLKRNQVPSFETNCTSNWNLKIDKIVEETKSLQLSMISGITPWLVMYMEALLKATKKDSIKDLFSSFQLMVHGGVNYRPYESKLSQLTGKGIHHLETYPASEGFIAFQTETSDPGLQLNVDAGVFYEFVPLNEIYSDTPTRLQLCEVELDNNYAIVINSNAGLQGYILGDVIKFISVAPYRLIFAGRVAHYISAFGEHIIEKDVNTAIANSIKATSIGIKEFSVAPFISKDTSSPSYHEWFIEFSSSEIDLSLFEQTLEHAMQQVNFQYADLVKGNVIAPLKINQIRENGFIKFMEDQGKLGGQNKVPRLANNRLIANDLIKYKV